MVESLTIVSPGSRAEERRTDQVADRAPARRSSAPSRARARRPTRRGPAARAGRPSPGAAVPASCRRGRPGPGRRSTNRSRNPASGSASSSAWARARASADWLAVMVESLARVAGPVEGHARLRADEHRRRQPVPVHVRIGHRGPSGQDVRPDLATRSWTRSSREDPDGPGGLRDGHDDRPGRWSSARSPRRPTSTSSRSSATPSGTSATRRPSTASTT